MRLLGLHIIDWAIILLYAAVLILIGRAARRKIHSTEDFFQGGRSFGKVLTTFLNFGNMISADQAAGVTREIYREGLSGVWFQNLVLFITPFYWFSAVLQRRARYVAPGDIYEHRFESKFLSGLFAVYLLVSAVYGSSIGYLITGKTLQAVMVKPLSECTTEEQHKIALFSEMRSLETKKASTPLDSISQSRLDYLHERSKRGEIVSSISYLNLVTFYLIYGGVTAAYVMMGGLFAAAFTDVLQGIMIFFLSTTLIPVGLHAIGGFSGLHAKVSEPMFHLFASGAGSNYTWYFVLTMVIVNLIGLAPRNFTVGGSAKDDSSARIGMVTGAFAKRLLIIGWALTGMIAIAIYGGTLSDSTFIWGTMTKDLLGVGFVGFMIASVLAANMASKAGSSLEWSAAFTKNILLPLRPATSERTQLFFGRIVILVVLISGIGFAYVVDDIFEVFKYVLSIGTIIGPALWLVYFWRRLNTKAVIVQMCLSLVVTVVMPNGIPAFSGVREYQPFLVETKPLISVVDGKRLETAGAPIFFEKIERANPEDPNSVKVGVGTFKAELWIMSLCGIDFSGFTKSGLDTASFAFDILLPFIVLFVVSLLTKPNSERVLNEFYARVHTPAYADAEQDRTELAKRIENPSLVISGKLFPRSNWEFWRPTRSDIVGFCLCWLGVGLIVGLYLLIFS